MYVGRKIMHISSFHKLTDFKLSQTKLIPKIGRDDAHSGGKII